MSEITINLKQQGKTAVIGKVGNHQVIVDRPLEKGGHDLGPMGGQYLLAGAGGCFASTLFTAAISRNMQVRGLEITVTASMSETSPSSFEMIVLKATCEYCSHPEDFEKLIQIAENGCIAINTLKRNVDIRVISK